MAVGVLIITHDGIGDAVLATAGNVFGRPPLATRSLAVGPDVDPEACAREGLALAAAVNSGDGVLVLSDLYGSTPANVAARVAQSVGGRLVSGLNLPMLVRVFNYPQLPLDELANRAVEGGRAGVVI